MWISAKDASEKLYKKLINFAFQYSLYKFYYMIYSIFFFLSFSPILLPIKDVPAIVTPIEVATRIKYIGKDFDNADKASGDIFPAKKVSTML